MKNTLIIDWLDKFGGAERVIASLDNALHFDKVYTIVNIMNSKDLTKTFPKFVGIINQTSLKIFGKRFRYAFPFFHFFINKIKIDKKTQIIISSSHAIAKGINKSSEKQLHVSYFQARNNKFIWDDFDLYFGRLKYLMLPIIQILRKIDCKQAKKPDYIVANSIFVQKWIKKIYNRDSTVIYPPVDLEIFKLQEIKEDYYVAIGRIVPYKRFDIIVDAFNINGKKLIIIGDGIDRIKLEKKAKQNINFTGFLDSVVINELISKSKGFIHSGIEDFGIAPVEAQACGTPVIALGKGGTLETIINKKTGLFFYEQTIEALNEAVNEFETLVFNPKIIRENALKFSKERYEKEIKEFVNEKYNAFKLSKL